jgi:hypothetical protein
MASEDTTARLIAFASPVHVVQQKLLRAERHFIGTPEPPALLDHLSKRVTACLSLFGHIQSVADNFEGDDADALAALLLDNVRLFVDDLNRELDAILKSLRRE